MKKGWTKRIVEKGRKHSPLAEGAFGLLLLLVPEPTLDLAALVLMADAARRMKKKD